MAPAGAAVRVQEAAIDMSAEIALLTAGRVDIGGIGCFVGVVRETAAGRAITAMTLEHYPGMTERALAGIAETAGERWPLLGCTLVHRVGRMLPGEAVVLVLAASSHRQAALEATGFLIDWLKIRAPFWKKEAFADGGEAWVDARESDVAATARWS